MTWLVWRVSPFITSIFFILGVFTLYEVLIDWLKAKIIDYDSTIKEHTIEAWFGIIYMVLFIYGLQATVSGKSVSWEFMNFQLVAIAFCAYFVKIRIPFYIFFPIVLIFMIINDSITYWQSWIYAFAVMLFYWSIFWVSKRAQKQSYPSIPYILTGAIYGLILWYIVKTKFSLSWSIFIQEWIYLIIFEILLYSYTRMLFKNEILKKHLTSSVNHDALTEAKNFAAFSSEMEYLFNSHQSNNLNLSMVMFDIDHFKEVNDTYGHLAGDEVLINVVDVVQTVLNATNPKVTFYRTGGEEFNILFPGYDLDATKEIVNQVFSALNHVPVEVKGQKIYITVSMGVSQLAKKDNTPTGFYNRVDMNLYYSKKHGRMRITAN
ncbi:GGDEF domain-containing protein [Lactobacillus halodurans]|uniref:GGDEF domain-containing protein n=1 Tax=Companilactobacillus halodurans TaxID=2584183 RepID=A0A5P0ZKZ1_9LACO|nr:GGDEF domain-containing protein [Companilactobacillus halodurans]MQS74878.1 GGDEF domain-containing protein [Companilactobacillus halodurans]